MLTNITRYYNSEEHCAKLKYNYQPDVHNKQRIKPIFQFLLQDHFQMELTPS